MDLVGHLQSTPPPHPLPKTKQGRRRFYPLGLKSLPPKSVNKIRLQYNKFQILKFCTPFILWPSDNLHLYFSTIPMGCFPQHQYQHHHRCQSGRFVLTTPGPYWVVICHSMFGTKVVIFEIFGIDHSANIQPRYSVQILCRKKCCQ